MTPFHAVLPAFFLIATAVAGEPNCLVSADLDDGIRVTFANSDWTEIRRIDGELFDIYEYYANAGYGHRYIAHQGGIPQQGFWNYRADQLSEGSRHRREFSVAPEKMVDLGQPGSFGTYTFKEVSGPADDSFESMNDLTLIVSEAPAVDVLGCSYAATLVEMREEWANPDPDNVVTWSFFLTDLGVAYLFAAKTMNGNLVSSPAVTIERLDAS